MIIDAEYVHLMEIMRQRNMIMIMYRRPMAQMVNISKEIAFMIMERATIYRGKTYKSTYTTKKILMNVADPPDDALCKLGYLFLITGIRFSLWGRWLCSLSNICMYLYLHYRDNDNNTNMYCMYVYGCP